MGSGGRKYLFIRLKGRTFLTMYFPLGEIYRIAFIKESLLGARFGAASLKDTVHPQHTFQQERQTINRKLSLRDHESCDTGLKETE